MKLTVTVIKADVGSIGGHLRPSQRLVKTIVEHVNLNRKGLLKDLYVSHTGDEFVVRTRQQAHNRPEIV